MLTEAIAPIRPWPSWSLRPNRAARLTVLVGLVGLVTGPLATLVTACSPAPAPKAQAPDPGDCLNGVAIEQLKEAIARCDAVVAAHPLDPQPLNDRALLLSLAHRQGAACKDSAKAAALLAQLAPGQPVDPTMAMEIRGRAASCRNLLASPPAPTPPLTNPPAEP